MYIFPLGYMDQRRILGSKVDPFALFGYTNPMMVYRSIMDAWIHVGSIDPEWIHRLPLHTQIH